MKKNKEIRAFEGAIEVRQSEEGESRMVEGYAAVYESNSEEMWGFIERIAPGAFDTALAVSDVRALVNHDPDKILARTASGTLTLSVDERGLKYSFEAPETTAGNDLLISLQRGDINQSSFGFTVAEDEWEFRDDGPDVRTITRVDRLFDVSPVTYPAYPDTTVAQRSHEAAKAEWEQEQKKEENHLNYQVELRTIKNELLKQ